MKRFFTALAILAVLALAVFIFIPPSREAEPLAAASAPEPLPEPVAPSLDAVDAPDFGAATLAVPDKPDFQKVVAFNEWAARWQTADVAARETMKAEGVRLAVERRPEFKALIVRDPQRALEQAVPRVFLQDRKSVV